MSIVTPKLIKQIALVKQPDIPKPILKWVGGKTQLLDKLLPEFPTEINNYREIFLGGGSVLLAVLSYVKLGIIKIKGQIYAHDLNEPLIWMYKNIQNNHSDVYDKLQILIQEFDGCPDDDATGSTPINRSPTTLAEAKQARETYYYWTRAQYNKLSSTDKLTPLGSAMFIFLNKTCFRGVFRVGPNGFNVPYGHYKRPEIINQRHLEEIHRLIQGVQFVCSPFCNSLSKVATGDYIYLDPPYAPESATSFVGYTEHGFDLDSHQNLFKTLNNLTDAGHQWMMSNSDVDLVRESFKGTAYTVNSVLCKRSINSKKPDSKAKEVILVNY